VRPISTTIFGRVACARRRLARVRLVAEATQAEVKNLLDSGADYCIIELIQVTQKPVPRFSVASPLMQIHITTADGVPIYQQIVNQVKYLVASGRLSPGDEMPPIRVLAERLIVNPNTVARAYRELESAGVVEKRRTAGTYVSEQGSPLARKERVKILTERVDALLAEARQMDVPYDELVKLLDKRNQTMTPPVG
jgi:GntR family transcriptional regulator